MCLQKLKLGNMSRDYLCTIYLYDTSACICIPPRGLLQQKIEARKIKRMLSNPVEVLKIRIEGCSSHATLQQRVVPNHRPTIPFEVKEFCYVSL